MHGTELHRVDTEGKKKRKKKKEKKKNIEISNVTGLSTEG